MTDDKTRDRIYAQRQDRIDSLVFDQRVAAVFPDMISRSVPGYASIIGMIGILAKKHAVRGSNLYDLGCSLGAVTVSMGREVMQRDCRLVAVDNASAMLEKAEEQFARHDLPPVQTLCCDIRDVTVSNASVVVLNFTLQFLAVEERLTLLRNIRAGMLDDGVLILSEKISGADEQEDELLIELHHAFKRANGYSDLEISQKRASLEEVLVPETIAIHRARLAEAGFSRVDLWFQCFNFVSFVARP
ncbi:carboxy-S-adenosyl-L-methionine synthase CmoA [Thiolapillus sp.]|uniref:carboxy-S-adenosyl-L-methionine synthase CmoA n=1 Tax=Thiolapillus sp. TaxID=2017437 RepID=UPI003AF6AD6F